MPHTFKLEQFEGPLDFLLQLIEQEELDVTTIALAQVCEQYVTHLRTVQDRSPEELADFLRVAVQLLYLKSRLLVPGLAPAEVEDTTGLTAQLKLYREFLEASHAVNALLGQRRTMYARDRSPVLTRTFVPPPRVTQDTLHEVLRRIVAELEPIVRIPQAVIGRIISIEERVAEIRQLLVDQPTATFEDVLRGRRSREEVIVSFLALLELVKQRTIAVTQEGRFGGIAIERVTDQAPNFIEDTHEAPVIDR